MKKETKTEIKVIVIVCAIVTAFIFIMSSGSHYNKEDLYKYHTHGAECISRRGGYPYFSKIVTVHKKGYSEDKRVYRGSVYSLKPLKDTYIESIFEYPRTSNEQGQLYYVSFLEYSKLDPETARLYECIKQPYD